MVIFIKWCKYEGEEGIMGVISEFSGKYYFLSNFYFAPVMYDGLMYLNNEAAFQSAKVLSKNERLIFCKLNPSEAKRLGRRVKLRSDWEEVKDFVMYEIVKDKFLRNDNLRRRLLETGDAILVEGNDWGDKYWGVCDGEGLNKLGEILMQVRFELREMEDVK